ncbi:MAG: hypothetical protein RIS29_2913 [Bacteroidota bacterium]|jgi:hypothetical protein
MRNKEIFKLIFNPFHKIAGWEALGLGGVTAIATALIGRFSNAVTDGALDLHLVQQTTFTHTAMFTGISFFSLIVCMTIAAFAISKSFRIVDIAGTISLAKTPILLAVLLGFFTTVPDQKAIIENPIILLTSATFIVVTLLIIPITIWSIALMFNAFKVSTGSKGSKLTIGFIAALLLAEIVSKIMIHYLIK